MKKWLKISIYSLLCLIPVGIVIGFSIPLNKKKSISCVGSSGVKPFIESFANIFDKSVNKTTDITVDTGGSGFGISQIAQSFANIGTASKNPYEAVRSEYKQQWTDNKIKTVTIGWEAICIVYIPPKGLSSYEFNTLNSYLNLTQDNISKLYGTFSGFLGGELTQKPNLGLFTSDKLSASDQELFNKTNIIPYSRSGGSLTSGTAASFVEGNHFDPSAIKLTNDQITSFSSGKYGNDFKIIDTDEANSRAWEIFQANNIPGSMIYLSSGFVQQNLDLIKNKHYGIMSYNSINFSIDNIKNGYNFFRPLNLMIQTDAPNKEARKFIEFLMNTRNSSHQYFGKWEEIGAKPIDEEDYQSMCKDNNFWISDVDLRLNQGRWVDNIILGAKDE